MNNPDTPYNEIDLNDLLKIIWHNKFKVISLSLLAMLLSLVISLSISNIYTSTAILKPKNAENSMPPSFNQLSSFASLGGIDLNSKNITKSDEAITRIKSFEFFSNNFIPNIRLENLVALDSWSYTNNQYTYNNDIYLPESDKWVREVKPPKSSKPSLQESYLIYKDTLKIFYEDENGFVQISMSNKSPLIAKRWVDIIIKEINKEMKLIELTKANNSINFLSEYSKSTNIQSLEKAISKLMEAQMQTLMMANANDDFVFEIIDNPIVPEEKSFPYRILITISGTLLGFIISCLYFCYVNRKQIYRKTLP